MGPRFQYSLPHTSSALTTHLHYSVQRQRQLLPLLLMLPLLPARAHELVGLVHQLASEVLGHVLTHSTKQAREGGRGPSTHLRLHTQVTQGSTSDHHNPKALVASHAQERCTLLWQGSTCLVLHYCISYLL
jgi:hypothetical protein